MKRFALLLVATFFVMLGPAWAAVPADPRVTAATTAWSKEPLYVDPDFTDVADGNQILREIAGAKVPVYVAVVPTGKWFQEKGDTELLAGWLAAANRKPGVYVVMDGDTTYGVAQEIAAYAPSSSWADSADESMSHQLAAYLDGLRIGDAFKPEAVRTEPLPPVPERTYPEDRFTVRKAIGNGLGGGALGLLGGAMLAGIVLGVAAVVARRGGRA